MKGSRWLLYGWATLVLVFVYWQFREAGAMASRMGTHAALVDGTVGSPFLYRVLAPATTEVAIRALRGAVGERRAFHLAYLAWNLVWVFLTFLLGDRFFRRWHRGAVPVLGSLLVGLALVVAFAEPPYAAWSVAETPLFLAGVLAFLEGRTALALAVVVVATLNRETALFIPLAWGALALPGVERACPGLGGPRAGAWRATAAGLLIWGAGYGALRVARGPAPAFMSAGDLLSYNLMPGMLLFGILLGSLLLGPFWWLWVRGWPRASPELRRLALVCAPILVLYLRFALWREVRVILPVVPIAIALGLHAVPLAARAEAAEPGL